MKTVFRTIHLYLSLVAGLIILITCFTGSVLVFEKELQEIFNKKRYLVAEAGTRLPIEKLIGNVKNTVPEAELTSVKIYTNPLKTIEIGYSVQEKETKENNGKSDKKGNADGGIKKTAYVNPYSGEVIELYSHRETFFYKMFALHRWLLGSKDGIGKFVVGVSTFIFLFILITGIILWWPKTKVILQQRLKIKWDGSWKRLNHDFHIVLGFYTAIFLFIFAFTGLSWSFKWFNKGVEWITNSEMKPSADAPASGIKNNGNSINLDQALVVAKSAERNAVYYNVMIPKDSAGSITINALPANAKEMESTSYYIDQYKGVVIDSLKFTDKNLAQKVRATLKPVHVGSIFGYPSKIIAFIVCLLGTTFPITGFIMWINRTNKKNRKQ